MKGLPIPGSLGGWICAVGLLFFLFIGYYGYLFPELHAFYFEERPGYPAFFSGTKGQCEPLKIRVDSPRQIAPFGKRWVYITIKNESASPVTVTVSLSVTPPLTGWYMPFLFGNSTSDTTAVSFSPLQPYATGYGRIPLFSKEEIATAVLYIITGTENINCSVTIDQPPKRDDRRYLIHAFTEQLLLPPWSNWILAAVGLLIPALVEPKEQKESEGLAQFSLLSLCRMFGLSLGLSLAFIAGVLVAASAIWWPVEEKEAGGVWNIAIIVVSIIVIILFVGRSLNVGLPRWLTNWLEYIRDQLQQKQLGSLVVRIIPLIPLVVTLILVIVILRLELFPLLKPLRSIFLVIGILELLKFLRSILYKASPELGGRNESRSDRRGPANTPGDKCES